MKLFGVEILPLKFDYNCVHKDINRYSERYIEIPIALAFVQNVLKDEKFLELGCTCPYYFKTLKNHIVYDLTDNHQDNIKKDIRDLTDEDYKSNIISISTLEHINQHQYGIELKEEKFSGEYIINKIVENSPKYLITVPIGQNKKLDDFLFSNDISKKKFVGRSPLNTDNWSALDEKDVVGEYRINGTYQDANCICIISHPF